jgi:hypothetical protein
VLFSFFLLIIALGISAVGAIYSFEQLRVQRLSNREGLDSFTLLAGSEPAQRLGVEAGGTALA